MMQLRTVTVGLTPRNLLRLDMDKGEAENLYLGLVAINDVNLNSSLTELKKQLGHVCNPWVSSRQSNRCYL